MTAAADNLRLAAVRHHLAKEYGLDETDLQEMETALISNLNDLRESLTAAVAREDWQTAGDNGHSLKGISASVGQEDLRALGLAIEQAGRSQDAATVREKLPAALAIIDELCG